MAGNARETRMLAAIRRVLHDDEQVTGRAWCWAAVRRPHIPLLVLGRRRFDAVLTDRRLILIARHHRELRPADIMLVKGFDALVLEEEHRRPTLLQQRVSTDRDISIVIEWPRRFRALGATVAEQLTAASDRSHP